MSDTKQLRNNAILYCDGQLHHVGIKHPVGAPAIFATLTRLPMGDDPDRRGEVRRMDLSMLEALIDTGDVFVVPPVEASGAKRRFAEAAAGSKPDAVSAVRVPSRSRAKPRIERVRRDTKLFDAFERERRKAS